MKSLLKLGCICVAIFVAANAFALQVIWDRSGLQDSSVYGYDILALGDQNNDGFADWAVSAHGNPERTWTQRPYLEFFHGGNPPSTIPYMTIRNISLASWGVAGLLGDINGDGYVDWFTKAFTDTNDIFRVNICFGGPSADTIPDLSLRIGWQDIFGTIDDFNGDGRSDLYWYHYYDEYVDIFYGATAMDWVPNWTRHSPEGDWTQAWPVSSGDLNGDGYDDWVSCEYTHHNTYIFLGGVSPDTIPAYIWPNMPSTPLEIANSLNGDPYNDLVFRNRDLHFGRPMLQSDADMTFDFPCGNTWPEHGTGLGDINGDGFGDLALYRSECNSWPGAMTLYLGHSWIYPHWYVYILSESWLDLSGIGTVAGVGDVNGDGTDDWGIGAYYEGPESGWRGRCIVIKGDTTLVAGAGERVDITPASFGLSCSPNPFNATTTLSFTLPKTAPVDLNVYDVTGRLVRQLAGGHIGPPLQAGTHDIAFDGSDLPSGIYFVRMEAGGMARTGKMVLLK